MKIIDVIPSRRWKNKATGSTASVYGAAPWTSDAEEGDWEMTVVGWTWRNDNGTVGLGRIPAKTREEAVQVMNDFNARH